MKNRLFTFWAITFLWVMMFSFAVPDISGKQVTYHQTNQNLFQRETQDSLLIMFISKDVDYDSIPLRFLKEAGYKIVTTYPLPLLDNQLMIDSLNNADLIIVGRSSISGDLAPSKLAWNHLTAPLLLMSQHSSARDKLNWFNSTTASHVMETADIKAYTSYKADTIFYGVNFLSGDTIAWATAPEDLLILANETNGTIMVRSDYLANAVNVVRFETGQPFYGEICDKPYAPRTFFATGLNTSGVLNPFPLTAEAKKVWLADINRLATTPFTPYVPSSDATLLQLQLGLGEYTPTFDPEVITYNATLPAGTQNIRVIVTPTYPCATYTGDGLIDVSSGTGSTEVVVKAEDGTTTKSYFINFTVMPTFVDNRETQVLQVIPNPANSYVKLVLNADFNGAELRIINTTGQVVLKKTISSNEEILDVRNLKSGVYFITILKENTFVSEKLTIN